MPPRDPRLLRARYHDHSDPAPTASGVNDHPELNAKQSRGWLRSIVSFRWERGDAGMVEALFARQTTDQSCELPAGRRRRPGADPCPRELWMRGIRRSRFWRAKDVLNFAVAPSAPPCFPMPKISLAHVRLPCGYLVPSRQKLHLEPSSVEFITRP